MTLDTEQEDTEGEGIVTACIGAFSSAVVGCIIEACDIAVKMVKKTEKRKGKELAKAIGDTAWKAATGGFVMGFVAPGTP